MSVRDSGHAFRSERSLTSQSGSTLLSQDGHRKLTSSLQSRATSAATTPLTVLSVLSTSLYPIPEVHSQNAWARDRVPAYGGYVIESEIKNDGGNFSTQLSPASLSTGAQNKSLKHSSIKPGEKTESRTRKKRGRPKKIVNPDNAGPDEVGFLSLPIIRWIAVMIVEALFCFLHCLFFLHSCGFIFALSPVLMNLQHRRAQLRLAQRAYRCRKERTISTLENRIAELENVIKIINDSHEAPSNSFPR